MCLPPGGSVIQGNKIVIRYYLNLQTRSTYPRLVMFDAGLRLIFFNVAVAEKIQVYVIPNDYLYTLVQQIITGIKYMIGILMATKL